jgi:hypothetical protein
MFGMPSAQGMGGGNLFQMKAGRLNLAGTTLTADTRKGLLILRKAEDGLMHLIWKDRNAGTVEDDLIVFEGDATIRNLDACKDGFAMLLEFSQTARKLFFYSQEPRKKGTGWEADDVSKEKELLDKANGILTGGSAAPAGGGAAAVAPGGALGMTQSELMALLGGAAAGGEGAPSASAAPTATGAAAAIDAAAAPASTSPAAAAPGGFDVSAALGGLGGAAPAAPAGSFSADSIANILGNIPPAPAAGGAAPAGGAFSADAISSILGNMPPAGAPPTTLNDVLHPASAAPAIDGAMEAALQEHLPQGGNIPESARDTLSTPQMAQVRAGATREQPPLLSTGQQRSRSTPLCAPAPLPRCAAASIRTHAHTHTHTHTHPCCCIPSPGGRALHGGLVPWGGCGPHPRDAPQSDRAWR